MHIHKDIHMYTPDLLSILMREKINYILLIYYRYVCPFQMDSFAPAAFFLASLVPSADPPAQDSRGSVRLCPQDSGLVILQLCMAFSNNGQLDMLKERPS